MDSRPARLLALREALARENLDGLLISGLANIRYVTGFSGSNGLVLVTALDCMLLTDFRYAVQIVDEVGAAADVRIEAASLWTGLWRELTARTGLDRIGFESGHLLHRDFGRLLEQGQRWQWRPTYDVVETLRETKDPGEIAHIVRAVAIAEDALEKTLPMIHTGMTETAVAGALEHNLRVGGSEGFPFASIVASGARAALPHARAGDRPIARGDLLLIDFGAIFAGYCSDITRTFVLGKADELQRDRHAVVRDANLRASGAIRVGMHGAAADALAREYIDARGYGDAFGHSLGHGIGLDVHESPRLAKTSESPLPSGAVVTIEPGIYFDGWGGIRVEDDVLLQESGPQVLTTFSRDLIELD